MAPWARRALALAAALACAGAAADEPAREPAGGAEAPKDDEVPTPEQVADMQLRLAQRQYSVAIQHGEDLVSKLKDLVDGVNVTETAHSAAKEALKLDDPDREKRQELKAEIRQALEALQVTTAADEATLEEEQAKQKAAKLRAASTAAAKKASEAASKAQALSEKAQALAQAESQVADKASREFQEAVGYNKGEVAKILRQEAEESQRVAEKFAQEQAQEEARRKAAADKAAAIAKETAEREAAMVAKEEAAKKRAEELEKRAESTTAAPETGDDSSPPAPMALAADEGGEGGDGGGKAAEATTAAPAEDIKGAADRIQSQAERQAVASAPGRFGAAVRGAAVKLKALNQARREAVLAAFAEEHKKVLAGIKEQVGQAKASAEEAKVFAKTAADARKVLGKEEPAGEDEDVASEAEKAGAAAEKLDTQVFQLADKELREAVSAQEKQDEAEVEAWESEAKELEAKADKAGAELKHFEKARAEALSLADVAAASPPALALAAVFGAMMAVAFGVRGSAGRRVQHQPPLLG